MNRTRRTSRHDRGVALLLVLVTMATATTLTIGWLATQDNATLIGRNVVATAEARSVASSGLDLAVSVMQTETQWRTMHQSGMLFESIRLGGGTVDLHLLDPTTNLPPTEDSMEIHAVSTATIGSITQSVAAYVSLLEDEDGESMQQDVSGFAIFSLSTIEINDNATVTRWHAAPASAMGRRIAMATASNTSRSVRIGDNAAAIDTTLYHEQDHSAALMINSTAFQVDSVELPWDLSLEGAVDPLPTAPSMNAGSSRRQVNRSTPDSMRLGSNQVLRITPATPLIVAGDLQMDPGSRIIVEGTSRMKVGGMLRMDRASIELQAAATLEAQISGGIVLVDSSIGSTEAWMNPKRITLSSGSGDSISHEWSLHGDSQITGSVEGRAIDLHMHERSIVRGRIAANSITLDDDSKLLYDHGLANGMSQPKAGRLLQMARSMTTGSSRRSSSPLGLVSSRFFESLLDRDDGRPGRRLRNRAARRIARQWTRPWNETPTPRTVPLECRMLTHGMDACCWESMAIAQEANP